MNSGPVVKTHVSRCFALKRQALEAAHNAAGVDGALDDDGKALAAVFVDHVQKLQDPSVRGLVELEVERPDDIGMGHISPIATPMPLNGLFLSRQGTRKPSS